MLLCLVYDSKDTGLTRQCRQGQCVPPASTLLRRAIIGSVLLASALYRPTAECFCHFRAYRFIHDFIAADSVKDTMEGASS